MCASWRQDIMCSGQYSFTAGVETYPIFSVLQLLLSTIADCSSVIDYIPHNVIWVRYHLPPAVPPTATSGPSTAPPPSCYNLFFFRPTTHSYVGLSSFLSPPSSHKGSCTFMIQSCRYNPILLPPALYFYDSILQI